MLLRVNHIGYRPLFHPVYGNTPLTNTVYISHTVLVWYVYYVSQRSQCNASYVFDLYQNSHGLSLRTISPFTIFIWQSVHRLTPPVCPKYWLPSLISTTIGAVVLEWLEFAKSTFKLYLIATHNHLLSKSCMFEVWIRWSLCSRVPLWSMQKTLYLFLLFMQMCIGKSLVSWLDWGFQEIAFNFCASCLHHESLCI